MILNPKLRIKTEQSHIVIYVLICKDNNRLEKTIPEKIYKLVKLTELVLGKRDMLNTTL